MKNIIKYELYKLISRKSFIITIVFGILFDCLLFYYNFSSYKKNHLTFGWINLINWCIPWFIIGFVLIITLSPIFSDEYANGVDSILLTCKNGKKSLATSKLIAACVLITAIFSLFLIFDLTLFFSFYHINMEAFYTHSFKIFLFSSYRINIFNYLILMLLIKLSGCLAFSILVIFISSNAGSKLITLFSSMLVLFIPFVMPIPQNSPLYFIKQFSYEKLINVNDFLNCNENFNIFFVRVPYFSMSILIFVIITAVLLLLTYKSYADREIIMETLED